MARKEETKPLPSLERLCELLAYEPATGVLTWRVSRSRTAKAGQEAGTKNINGYRIVRVDMVFYAAHRLIWKIMTAHDPPEFVDHINRDKLDNRWCNLRLAGWGENRQNATLSRNNTSGHKGIAYDARQKKWRVLVGANKRTHHIGYFRELSDACEARSAAIDRLHGEFARVR